MAEWWCVDDVDNGRQQRRTFVRCVGIGSSVGAVMRAAWIWGGPEPGPAMTRQRLLAAPAPAAAAAAAAATAATAAATATAGYTAVRILPINRTHTPASRPL